MNSISTELFSHSRYSIAGEFIASLQQNHSELFQDSTSRNSLCDQIWKIWTRFLASIFIVCCAAVDLCLLTVFTVTVIPALYVGIRDHLYNLTSTIALIFQTLVMPLNKLPAASKMRVFWPIPITHDEHMLASWKDEIKHRKLMMWDAAMQSNFTRVQELLDEGDNPNYICGLAPPIFQAIFCDEDSPAAVETIQVLLRGGAKPNITHDNRPTSQLLNPRYGSRCMTITPLMMASNKGYKLCVEALLKHPADPNQDDNKAKATALHFLLWEDKFRSHQRLRCVEYIPFNERRTYTENEKAIVKMLLHAEAVLPDQDLQDVSDLLDAFTQNEMDRVDEMIASNAKRARPNPFLTLCQEMPLHNTDSAIREQSIKHLQSVIALSAEIKKIKREIVEVRTAKVFEALQNTGLAGIKPIAELISQYCYS